MRVFRKKIVRKWGFQNSNLTIHYPNPSGGPGAILTLPWARGTLTLPGASRGFQNTRFEILEFEIVVFHHLN